MEWQPIETAQKGTSAEYSPRILAADKNGQISIAYHDGHSWLSEVDWELYYDVLTPREWEPTHWMPLPNPPSPSEKHYDSSEA